MQKTLIALVRKIDDTAPGNDNAAQFEPVEIRNYPSNTLATIYSDNGITQISNPITSDTDGMTEFYAANGRYSLTFPNPSIPDRVDTILLNDPTDENLKLPKPFSTVSGVRQSRDDLDTPTVYTCSTVSTDGGDRYGVINDLAADERAYVEDGILIEGDSTNLLLNSATPATQSITLLATTYTISVYGTGDITTIYGTATEASPLTFTSAGEVLLCTVNGALIGIQAEPLPFATSLIKTLGSPVTRQERNLTLAALNNIPELSKDHTWSFNLTSLLGDASGSTASTVALQLSDAVASIIIQPQIDSNRILVKCGVGAPNIQLDGAYTGIITVTYKAQTNTQSFYLDGLLILTNDTVSWSGVNIPAGTIYLGRNQFNGGGTANHINGTIGFLKTWQQCLTAQQVALIC